MFAQSLPPQSDIDKMPASGKMLLYDMNKKSPTWGVINSLLLSSCGHAYAKNWKRGLYFAGAEIGGVVGGLMLYDIHLFKNRYQPDGHPILSYLSWTLAGVMRIWEVIDAGKEVKKYNRRVYKTIYGKEPPSFSLNLQPTYKGANLSMTYSFK